MFAGRLEFEFPVNTETGGMFPESQNSKGGDKKIPIAPWPAGPAMATSRFSVCFCF